VAQPKIFVSRGTPYTPAQERFCDKLYEYIRSRGGAPVTVGGNKYGVRQPVELAREEIKSCAGAVVVAFKRIHIREGQEKPDSTEAAPVDGRVLPTVWNHMEAAIAYTHDLPLLVLVEKGVYREGMLSKRLEWDALEIDVDAKVFKSDEFIQRFDQWMSFVEQRCKGTTESKIDPTKLTLRELLGALTTGQLWSMAGALFGALAAVAVAAYKVGVWSAKP
jgi:hypothetical protein